MISQQSPFPSGFAIITPRLRITPLDPSNETHCTFLAQLWNTDLFIRSCGRTSVVDATSASEFIRTRILADYERNKHGMFLVSLQEQDPQSFPPIPIGTVSLMKGAPPNRHYLAPDIGYAILPEMNGRGYATEAAKGLLEWARVELGITDVFGFCDARNLHSRRVLEKLGMDFRGVAALEVFGGAESAVCTLPGMSEDLSVYGLTEDIRKEE
ncbi:uncharacterized protein N7484_010894 [Penicillium longicatenatum]|uniref:uncharacterized protein n=1 Tax=Penicillium longicatenatum TaxID=1561947 RepID=UPI002547EDFC|nr:uncharacterized protein N7484_010894 [Penicillium longicatenatum]KAJ5630794.1 hypothetical protein N7484_010894 [Penicillium longicatenatum]